MSELSEKMKSISELSEKNKIHRNLIFTECLPCVATGLGSDLHFSFKLLLLAIKCQINYIGKDPFQSLTWS